VSPAKVTVTLKIRKLMKPCPQCGRLLIERTVIVSNQPTTEAAPKVWCQRCNPIGKGPPCVRILH